MFEERSLGITTGYSKPSNTSTLSNSIAYNNIVAIVCIVCEIWPVISVQITTEEFLESAINIPLTIRNPIKRNAFFELKRCTPVPWSESGSLVGLIGTPGAT